MEAPSSCSIVAMACARSGCACLLGNGPRSSRVLCYSVTDIGKVPKILEQNRCYLTTVIGKRWMVEFCLAFDCRRQTSSSIEVPEM